MPISLTTPKSNPFVTTSRSSTRHSLTPAFAPTRCRSLKITSMSNTAGTSLYPLHRCKTVHLVRHAQGIHNVPGDHNYQAYLSPELFDAHLTPLGWKQYPSTRYQLSDDPDGDYPEVDNLNKHVHASGLAKRVEVVITSPLLRTMQTAVGAFGGGTYVDGVDTAPLMVTNAGYSNHPAISSLNCPPFIAVELCREHLGVHPCDKRRSISEYRPLFPGIDFSLIETDEDTLWKADVRETIDELAARGMRFLDWLWTRKEKEIAVVTHSGFLFHTLSTLGKDCHPVIKDEISKHFANCELRSMVLVDRNMIGSDLSTTNFPGKIPQGPDLPSEIADEKHSEKQAKANSA